MSESTSARSLRTPLVKITKPKRIDLRTSLEEREEPIGNATINTLFASPSAAYSYPAYHRPGGSLRLFEYARI